MKNIYFLFLIVLLASCAKEKNTIVKLDNIQTKEIHLKKMILEDAPLFPKGCCLVDSSLVIFDPKDKDGFLFIYNLNGQLLGKYGTKGNGPNDFIQPRFISNGKSITNSKDMCIGDINAVYTLNLDSALVATRKKHLPYTEIPEKLSMYNYILQNTNDMLVVQQTGENQLTFYDKNTYRTDFRNYFKKIPSLNNASDLCYVMQIYDAHYSSNDKTMAIAYKNRKQIDILSLSGDLINRIYFPDYDYNDTRMSLRNRNLYLSEYAKMFFSFIFTTVDSYYFLCWDDTRENIKAGKAKTKIYKTDSYGNVQGIMQLDKSISYFCLNQSHIYAIGISEENLDLEIYYADI